MSGGSGRNGRGFLQCCAKRSGAPTQLYPPRHSTELKAHGDGGGEREGERETAPRFGFVRWVFKKRKKKNDFQLENEKPTALHLFSPGAAPERSADAAQSGRPQIAVSKSRPCDTAGEGRSLPSPRHPEPRRDPSGGAVPPRGRCGVTPPGPIPSLQPLQRTAPTNKGIEPLKPPHCPPPRRPQPAGLSRSLSQFNYYYA